MFTAFLGKPHILCWAVFDKHLWDFYIERKHFNVISYIHL